MSPKPQPERVTWASGASRHAKVAGETDRHPRFDLISPVGHRRLAEVYGEGALAHGDRNWERGMPEDAILNHLEAHLVQWKAGDRSEDHLAKVAWGVYALMHFEERLAVADQGVCDCQRRAGRGEHGAPKPPSCACSSGHPAPGGFPR